MSKARYFSAMFVVSSVALGQDATIVTDATATQSPQYVFSYDAKTNETQGNIEINGVQVTIETKRGKRNPALARKNDPSAPEYAIDVRIIDQNGTPIFVQVGGNSPIDKKWSASFDSAVSSSTEDRGQNAQQAFAAVDAVLSQNKTLMSSAALAPEQAALTNLRALIKSTLVTDSISGYQEQEFPFSAQAACTEIQIAEIWKKPTLIFAEHSGSVAKWKMSNGTIYTMWSACNHGTCPGDSTMSKKCSKSFLLRCGYSRAAPNCSTAYGLTKGYHVCNDDTYIQYDAIKRNYSPSTTGGTCSDASLRAYAPSCD